MAADGEKTGLTWGMGPIAFDGTRTPLKTALFLVVCVAWVLPGLIGHDPWKTDEAIVFGIVNEILRTGDWASFGIAGEAFTGEAPLFPWTAAALAKLLGGSVLPVHDAARLAAGLYMAATLGLLSAAAWNLMGERAVRMSVLLMIGSLGLLIRAHEMTADLAGLAGIALAFLGLTLSATRPWQAGLVTGIGAGIAYLGNGLLPLAMVAALVAILPVASPKWRTRAFAATALIAVACVVPFVLAWTSGLPAVSEFGQGLNLGLLYFLKLFTWYAWPAWPLAAWTVWRARKVLPERTEIHLPLVAFAVFFVVVAVFGESREVSAMPLLVPLAILGVAELESLPRGAASALDWFGVMTFFLMAALIWIGWGAALTGKPDFALAFLQKEVPGFAYQFDFLAFALAALLSLVWIVVVARSLRSTRRALVNWAAGITMVWMLVMTLGVPLVDQARSYRAVASRLKAAIPPGTQCVARLNVGDAQRALLDYFASVRTLAPDAQGAQSCSALLVQASPLRLPRPGSAWTEAWRGSRPGDRNELFILYTR